MRKIFHRWSRDFGPHASPREVWRRGLLPWKWSTWCEAHRVAVRGKRSFCFRQRWLRVEREHMRRRGEWKGAP